MATLHVSLAFASLPDMELNDFTLTVYNGLDGNAAYTPLPITATLVILDAARDDFDQKISKAKMGGPVDTAAKNVARQGLIGVLRILANHVEGKCNNDLATLLSSGFEAASTERRREPLETPEGLRIKNGGSGRLVASVGPVKNTKLYEGRIKGPTGDWTSVFTGDSQHIIFDGLTAGTTYTIQVRALGGLTGQSDWSDPSSHMSM